MGAWPRRRPLRRRLLKSIVVLLLRLRPADNMSSLWHQVLLLLRLAVAAVAVVAVVAVVDAAVAVAVAAAKAP